MLIQAAGDLRTVAGDVLALGGSVERLHDTVGIVTATLPADQLDRLRADSDVAAVTVNSTVTLSSTNDSTPGHPNTGGRTSVVADAIGADDYLAAGYDGSGIDVALIDSGVANVAGLSDSVINGVDLSFDALIPGYWDGPAFSDGFGHGTHMAGIITGNGDDVMGVAPGARVVNVKVGDHLGKADVTQIIAGIDWVIQNANTDGRNIRVINLSFGTDASHTPQLDPVAHAVQTAFDHGIVTVVSAGNRGTTLGRMDMPASHPAALSVGATDMGPTTAPGDDTVPSWSSHGDGVNNPHLIVPGKQIISVGVPGSTLWEAYPDGHVEGALMRGSGTSQSAAVMSAAVALVLDYQPAWGPAEVLVATRRGAVDLGLPASVQGAGVVDLTRLMGWSHRDGANWNYTRSTGDGDLDTSRGSYTVTMANDQGTSLSITGNMDFTGSTWNGSTWNGSTWNGSTWNGSTWNGSTWNGSTWNGSTWNGSTWNGSTWNATGFSSAFWD